MDESEFSGVLWRMLFSPVLVSGQASIDRVD